MSAATNPKAPAARGRYVALEGGEGAGKSTVAARLAERLTNSGLSVIVVREPGGTGLGEGIRNLLLHTENGMAPWAEAMLFAAQRAQLVAEVIAPALRSGQWVISDRSYYSSLAYQGAARGLGVAAVRTINELAVGGVVPDLVVVLLVDPLAGLGRQSQPDRIGRESLDFFQRVADAYRQLAKEEPGRVLLIDNGGDLDAVVSAVLEAVR